MWKRLADFIIRFRVVLLVLVLAITAVMGFFATKVEMSYDFNSAIPKDNPKLKIFQDVQKKFGGGNGNTMLLAIQTDKFFDPQVFIDFVKMNNDIKDIDSVQSVLSVVQAVNIVKDENNKMGAAPIFDVKNPTHNLDSAVTIFKSLPVYNNLLYNPDSNTYLMAIGISPLSLASKDRTRVVDEIVRLGDEFGAKNNIEMHYSGMPLIRTQTADKVKFELKLFLVLSLALTAIILLALFRDVVAVLVSLGVVIIGVVWSVGLMGILGYKITILSGMVPPLIVVIGIPNCIYFLNKYHSLYAADQNKVPALKGMVATMGIVTLFTNLTGAIGLGVFSFTESILLKEFGVIAGVNIMALFFISLIMIPAVFSFLPAPNASKTSYMESKWMTAVLDKLNHWVTHSRPAIFIATILLCIVAVVGVSRLKAVGFVVDDLPSKDKIYTDLKFFERNFKGVMPMDIVIDTKKKYGALMNLKTWENIDELTNYLEAQPEIGGGLTLVKGVKFVKQGLMGGGIENYTLPNSTEFSALRPQLISAFKKAQEGGDATAQNAGQGSLQIRNLLYSFIDSTGRYIRLTVNVADIGSEETPKLVERITPVIDSIFSNGDYETEITGSSVVYLEGSKFIISSLKESLLWAFGMIIVCIVLLFRSPKVILIALVTNIVPLLLTAGVMGWMDIRLKPSTVLVFSVALGIAIDVTIRFLVNYKQELPNHNYDIKETVHATVHETGLSILFTTIILMAGFGVFIFSQFDGTKSLGLLLSLTLFMAMVFNLTLLPALLMWVDKAQKKKLKS